MKILIKISTFITVLCLIFSSFLLSASAASSATLHFSKDTVKVGDTVTVSVNINPGKAMYAVSFNLEYDDSVLKYKSGSGTGDAGVLKVVESPSGTKSEKYSFKFTALKAGTSVFSVTDCVYEKLGDNGAEPVKFGGASAKMTVKDPELSSNAKLKSLKISGYSLSPSFSSSRTSYTATVPFEVEKISVSAKTSDSDAKVKSVSGNTNLKVGKNTVTVSVEAPNGTLKKYTITVTRLKESESVSSDTSSVEDIPDSPLQITVEDKLFTIVTELPEDVLFDGFSVDTTKVNGYDIETAVDKGNNYRIFYLKSTETDELAPYLYDSELDSFEKLKYIIYNKNCYIFSTIPDDYNLPQNLYPSSVTIDGVTVQSVTDSDSEMSDFHYIYCFANGEFNLYRYDSSEATLQRYPDFKTGVVRGTSNSDSDSFFARFASLSTNGKIIIIAIGVVILGILALFALLMTYFIKKSINRQDNIYLMGYGDEFDSIEVKKE